MYRYLIGFAIIICLIFAACGDNGTDSNTGRLFSLRVTDYQGNPMPSLRLGSINHHGPDPDLKSMFLKPCPSTEISFDLPVASDWELYLYDYYRNQVREFSGYSSAGSYTIVWDGTDDDGNELISGFYSYELIAGEFNDEKAMILEKGPDPHSTIIAELDNQGRFETDDTLYFPCLLGDPPYEYYRDTVTLHLSSSEVPDSFLYFVRPLSVTGNEFDIVLTQEDLDKITAE